VKKTIGAVVLVIGLIVVACDGGADASPTPESSPEPTTVATEAPEPAEEPVAAETVAAAATEAATERPAESMPSEEPLEDGQVTGTITLPEGAEVPVDAVVDIIIARTGGSGPGSLQIRGADAATSPIAFAVDYSPADVDESVEYRMDVEIRGADRAPLFVEAEPVLVITDGNPVEGVEVMLVAVAE
jgi:uncharacterized lipoprotein YbaY